MPRGKKSLAGPSDLLKPSLYTKSAIVPTKDSRGAHKPHDFLLLLLMLMVMMMIMVMVMILMIKRLPRASLFPKVRETTPC